MRLDVSLRKKYPHITRRELFQFFRGKKIFVGDRPAVKSDLVDGTEDLRLPPEFHQPKRRLAANLTLKVPVVFEDDSILVVSKPAGLPSVPHSYDEMETLANFLIAHNPELVGVGDKPLEPGMVHRLDTATMGLMVAAKTGESFKNLKNQFRERKVLKEYLALVEGVVEKAGEINHPIGADPKNIRKVKIYDQIPPSPPFVKGGSGGILSKGGRGDLIRGRQEAITKYRVEKTYPETTLLRVRIITGVRHQIRAHLAFIGHPVVRDELYGHVGATRRVAPTERMHLHACKLGFFHPATGQWMEFDDPHTFPLP